MNKDDLKALEGILKEENNAEESVALFEIAPLKWKKVFNKYGQVFRASTPFGIYEVHRERKSFKPENPWTPWRWGYCFGEYYDEKVFDCANSKEGKRLAFENWVNRLSGVLIRKD